MNMLAKIEFTMLAAVTAAVCHAADATPANGSFEKGLAGYYVNRRDAVKVETGKASDGAKFLSVDPAGQKKISVVFNTAYLSGATYQLSFDAATTQPENGPALTLAVMLQGKTPICFYPGASAEQKKALATPVKLETEWKNFTFELGPVPAEMMKQEVKRLMFYLDTTPGAAPGLIRLDNIRLNVAEKTQLPAPADK